MTIVTVAMGDKRYVTVGNYDHYAYQIFHNRSSHHGDIPHVCLPFATDAKGQTLQEKMVEEKFLLEDGHYEFQYKPFIFVLRLSPS